MVPHTRRRFLHVAAAAAGGLAGCSDLTTGEAQSTESATPAAESNRPASDSGANRETDPPRVLVRAATDRPPVRLPNPDRDRESPEPYERERLSMHARNAIIDSQSRADRLVLADGVDEVTVRGGGESDDGAGETVAAFVDETDFDSETIYLESHRVRECFRLKLCHVSWQPSEIDTDYTQRLRPYDERCEADAHVVESRLIRLPVALDEDDVNSYGSSIGGSGHCDPRGAARAEGESGEASSDSGSGSDSSDANESSGASGQLADGGDR